MLFKKFAKLEYRVVNSIGEQTLFDIKLYTGRQHQIRVQMANMGCPLLGDSKYGSMKSEDTNQKPTGLALCSYRLEFVHPVRGMKMDYKIIPEGEIFKDVKQTFGQE